MTNEHDIIARLRQNSDGKDTCAEAAALIAWQAKELRHLARCVSDRDRRIRELEEKLNQFGVRP